MSDVGPIWIDHIGIATSDLDQGSRFWKLMGLSSTGADEEVLDQGVRIRFFSTAEGPPPRLEVIAPLDADSPISKFLAARGPGIQQLALRVDNLDQVLDHLHQNGVMMIDAEPRIGADGCKIAFVHPRSTGGVLVELVQSKQSL